MKPNTDQPKTPESKPESKDDLKSVPLPEVEKILGLGETQKEKSLAEKTRVSYTDCG
jgi:hypothetical protein